MAQVVYLENLEVDKKKVILSGIVESVGITYVGEKQYCIDTLVREFEYFVFSQSTYSRVIEDFQLPNVSTIIEMTSKVKTIV